jgi:Right handed beta helix region
MKRLLSVRVMVVLVFTLAGIVRAQTNVTVDCSGNNHQAFQSINAALNTLNLVGPNTITVSGTCHENVSIAQRDRLTIQAAAGHFASIENAANPPAITLLIAGSHNIVLNNLVIQGGSPALYVTDSSTATAVQNCVVQNSAADGLDVDMESELVIQNSTIKNNSAAGIVISNESQMTLGTYPTQRIRITGNGFGGGGNGNGGLEIDGSQVQLNFGVVTIDGNAGPGISMDGGRLQFYGGDADSPGTIENNNIGLTMTDAASATFWSAFRIHNNGSTGISIGGASSITLISTVDSNGQNAVTTIDGHSTVGLALGGSSSAQIYGPHMISKNGSANADPGSRGGISMAGASLTIGGGTLVNGNVGPGIRLFAKSDLTMFDMVVSNNTEQGVTETNLSSGGFYDPLTFSGNGEGSLVCDALSVAYGDAGSIGGVNCKNITSSGGQRPSVRISKMH